MNINTEGSPTDTVAEAVIASILEAKAQMKNCRCGASVGLFRVVFPEKADRFSAVCLGCQAGSAFVVADDYEHPILIMKMARHINRTREALGYMVEQWNAHNGPFQDPGQTILMRDILPHDEDEDGN